MILKYEKCEQLLNLGGRFIGVHCLILLTLHLKIFVIKSRKKEEKEPLCVQRYDESQKHYGK